MSNLIPYGKQKIFKNDFIEVKKALNSDYLSGGNYVKKFENSFKNFTGAKFVLSCSSGTAALHLALKAINVKKNDNIIIPSINFIAAANLCKMLKANIFLADADYNTGQMGPNDLLNCIKKFKIKNLKAFFSMYNGGNPENVKEFAKIKRKLNTIFIEDACHALGANYYDKNNTPVGSCKYSDISIFSFHSLKSITTGEGGMITTSDKNIFNKIKLLRNHGILRKSLTKKKYSWSYSVVCPGFNYRLSDLNCALGYSQLKKLNKIIMKRKKIAYFYEKKLKNFSEIVSFPEYRKHLNSAWHLYIIQIKFDKLKILKDNFIQQLYKNRIITQVHYIPTYHQKTHLNLKKFLSKKTEKYYKNSLSLPIFFDLKESEQNYIVNKLKQLIKKYKR